LYLQSAVSAIISKVTIFNDFVFSINVHFRKKEEKGKKQELGEEVKEAKEE